MVRWHGYGLLRDRLQGFPEVVVDGVPLRGWTMIDGDGMLINAPSDKQGARGTYKGTFGHHVIVATCDNTGEQLAAVLYEGNVGAKDTAVNIGLLARAVAQFPVVAAEDPVPGERGRVLPPVAGLREWDGSPPLPSSPVIRPPVTATASWLPTAPRTAPAGPPTRPRPTPARPPRPQWPGVRDSVDSHLCRRPSVDACIRSMALLESALLRGGHPHPVRTPT